jgi:hypothetical protein
MSTRDVAVAIASVLPVVSDIGIEYSSLQDIVITGIETPWANFLVDSYTPNAGGGAGEPWAVIRPLPEAAVDDRIIELDALSVRRGVEAYSEARLEIGWSIVKILFTLEESVTDAEIADSILQFIAYGEEVIS